MINRQHDWMTMSTDHTISTSSLASWRVRNRKLADPLAEGPIDGCWIEWHASNFHDPVGIERPAVVERE